MYQTSARRIDTQNAYTYIRAINSSNAKRKAKQSKKSKALFLFKLALLAIVFAAIFKFGNYALTNFNLLNFANVKNNVDIILQNPELPNGCEVTSLAMALNAAGLETDKLQAYDALPKAAFSVSNSGITLGSSPDFAYAGDARLKSGGYYCFAPPVVEAANNLLRENGIAKTAKDITGSDIRDIERYLEKDIPVITWVTINYETPQYCENFIWYITDKAEQYRPYSNLHCVLLSKKSNGQYIVNDPLKGVQTVNCAQFEESYIQMGRRAVIIE